MRTQQVLAKQALHQFFARLSGDSFRVSYKDGTNEYFGDGKPKFVIRIKEEDIGGLFSEDLLVSFGEAYMDGQVDVDGDLADLVSTAIRSGLLSVTGGPRAIVSRVLSVGGFGRSIKREKENIAHHYDLGNDFFRLWLDESMTYSCAYFRDASDSLEQAQKQKNDLALRKLRLHPTETLLDIGCGWGSLLVHAADNYGAAATGMTHAMEGQPS